MKLQEFKALLEANQEKNFLLQLPNEQMVPQSFHITEVGLVSKTFIDCGGRVHTVQTCQLQAWIGSDTDHRLEAGKMAKILKIAESIVPDNNLDVEIEYEDEVISQYPVAQAVVSEEAVTLHLTTKHTDCLAKELCLTPASNGEATNGAACCGPSCC